MTNWKAESQIRGLTVGTIIVGFIVLTFLICFTSYLLFTKRRREVENKKRSLEFYEYQLLQYDPSTKISSIGFATHNEILEEGQFVSKVNSDGTLELISPFGMQEYQCTGTCHCNYRRSGVVSSQATKRFVQYLVAASSGFLALNAARNHFSEECTRTTMLDCPTEYIESKVDQCEMVKLDDQFVGELTIAQDDKRLDFEDESYAGERFLCTGWCVIDESSMLKLTNFLNLPLPKEVEETCKKMHKTAIIKVYYDQKNERSNNQLLLAQEEFRKNYLLHYCRSDVFFLEKDFDDDGVAMDHDDYKCCEGQRRNENIHCRYADLESDVPKES